MVGPADLSGCRVGETWMGYTRDPSSNMISARHLHTRDTGRLLLDSAVDQWVFLRLRLRVFLRPLRALLVMRRSEAKEL